MSPLPCGRCDPMWHESSRSGVATLRTAIHLLLTYLLVSYRIVCSVRLARAWVLQKRLNRSRFRLCCGIAGDQGTTAVQSGGPNHPREEAFCRSHLGARDLLAVNIVNIIRKWQQRMRPLAMSLL